MNRTALTAAALILASFAGTASAADRHVLASSMHAVGRAIASQGNAALIQIREELRRDLAESLKPLLPSPDRIATPASAVQATAKR